MFKMCCGECGECWWVGNPRACKCPDEKPVWDASVSLVMTPNPVFAKREWVPLTKEDIAHLGIHTTDTYPEEFIRYVEARCREKNT